MDTIRIFIATEDGHEKAEKALEMSLIKTTSGPFKIFWMKNEHGDLWKSWNKGRNHLRQNSGEGWKTNFSCYRWAIPELCEFSGKAIYLDVDQIVLKDIRKMWELDTGEFGVLSITPEKTDVMLINCAKFIDSWWPRLETMKPSGKHQKHYRCTVQSRGLIGRLDADYNCLDGEGFSETTRLVHYTKMSTQPWRPSPDSIKYKPHKHLFLENMWWGFYYKALDFEKENGVTLGP